VLKRVSRPTRSQSRKAEATRSGVPAAPNRNQFGGRSPGVRLPLCQQRRSALIRPVVNRTARDSEAGEFDGPVLVLAATAEVGKRTDRRAVALPALRASRNRLAAECSMSPEARASSGSGRTSAFADSFAGFRQAVDRVGYCIPEIGSVWRIDAVTLSLLPKLGSASLLAAGRCQQRAPRDGFRSLEIAGVSRVAAATLVPVLANSTPSDARRTSPSPGPRAAGFVGIDKRLRPVVVGDSMPGGPGPGDAQGRCVERP
jgi:hypothetical protein